MTDAELSDVQVRCDTMHACVTDLSTCCVLAELHRGLGNAGDVEGCRQTVRAALDSLQMHLDAIRKVALAVILMLVACPVRADDFADSLRALEAANAKPAVKPAPVVDPFTPVNAAKPTDSRPGSCGCDAGALCTCHGQGQRCGCHDAGVKPAVRSDSPANPWRWSPEEGGTWWRYRRQPGSVPYTLDASCPSGS